MIAVSLFACTVRLATAQSVQGTLVQSIDASNYNPPSPDTSGATHLDFSDTILLSDSEVNEIPSLFTGDNLFEIDSSGSLLNTLTTIPFSDEPTGLAYNPWNGHLFVSDDTGTRAIYNWNPGPDGLFDTADDSTIVIRTGDFNSTDPEGVAFDSWQGLLYLVDGVNSEIYEIDPGANGIFDGVPPAGDDQVTSLDTASLGVTDPEGLTFDSDNGHLYVIGKPTELLLHITTSGAVVRTVDVSSANMRKPAGLAYAPSSLNPPEMNVYITDRGVDNGSDPNENDGMVYEFSIPSISSGNMPPSVDAGPDQSITLPDTATLDGTVSDDGIPGPLTTTWSHTSGPGTATFADTTAVDTTASFSTPGSYILRLTADDGELSANDELSVNVIGSGGETTIEVSVLASSDDAEEKSTGGMRLTSGDLDMVFDGSADQTIGMRFSGLAIEPGAEIQNAHIQFQADETDSIATSLSIQGEATDNASTFVSTNGNITTRPRTTAAVAWVPDPWTKGDAGIDQRTPDIASVIQEIVDRPGWVSGNSLVIMISGTGERTAESFEGNQAAAPMLHVDLGVAQLSISPTAASVAPGGSVSCSANGGEEPYTFSLFANNSGGSINPSTGAYTVGSTGGVSDTVRVTDKLSATADATVMVTIDDPGSSTVSIPALEGITYRTQGGRNSDKHLSVDVSLVDDAGSPVAGATVSIELWRDTTLDSTATGFDDDGDGVVTFDRKNAPSGCYSTNVTAVSASGLTWDGVTPPNEFEHKGATCAPSL